MVKGTFYSYRSGFAGNADNQQFGQSTAASALFDNANQALVGRVAYDYKSKYLIEFAFRYEGSSKFPANSRWAMFPSVSGGWRVSEESLERIFFEFH